MTCQPIAISVEKVISAWLDVLLPVSICTRGEVFHHLARLSVTAEWTTEMTGRNERTACDLWISQHSPASCQRAADVSIGNAVRFFSFLFSVSELIFLLKRLEDDSETERSLLLSFVETLQNKICPRKERKSFYYVGQKDLQAIFHCSSGIYFYLFVLVFSGNSASHWHVWEKSSFYPTASSWRLLRGRR